MKKLITAQEFEEAFRSQWEEDRCSPKYEEKINNLISGWDDKSNELCTTFMLGDKGEESGKKAFFYRVLQKLKGKDIDMEFTREKGNKFDGIYHRPESLLPQYKDYYSPPCLDVLIEHENDYDRIEQEMWKLLMFRSPLKVLVSYDYSEKKKTTSHRRNFVEKKLNTLADMRRQVDEKWKEWEDTEYLIVIGNLVDNIVIWEFKKL